ncbi:FHA domain-containing protein [Chryseolinea sp. T2]|uniref:FHA domain-containing protein n=1 Tax=Chryseolinea sp. T2 TaxID=3129255 RepID=UPI0030777DBD
MARSTDRFGEKPAERSNSDGYVLEFLTGSTNFPVGSSKSIRSAYVTFGREVGCDVQFGADQSLVSRRHAAIEKRGDKFSLIQLSDTNQTLLNGRPVNKEWSLQGGDEIQLSPNGPRIRFMTSAPKPASLGFTKRIQIFSQQALKPYKRAIVLLITLFVIGSITVFFVVKGMRKDNAKLANAYAEINRQSEEQQLALRRGDSLFVANQKATVEKLAESNREREKIARELKDLKMNIRKLQQKPVPASVIPALTISRDAQPLLKMIDDVKNDIYFLRIYLTINGQLNREDIGSGTGIMLSDGRFVTSRQCVQPWIYADVNANDKIKEQWLLINWLYNNSPKGDVRIDLEVLGTDGKKNYLTGDKFTLNQNHDLVYNIDVGYGRGKVQLMSDASTDWAVLKIDGASADGLEAGFRESQELAPNVPLHFISYTKEIRDGKEQILPSHLEIPAPARDAMDGLVKLPKFTFKEGNSGSPVFVQKDNRLLLVGLLTELNKKVVVVPIHALNND